MCCYNRISNDMYTIEKGVPVPGRHVPRSRKSRRDLRWPMSVMEVGDSFIVPRIEADALRQVLSAYSKRYSIKLVTQLQPGGALRCWRVSDVDPFS